MTTSALRTLYRDFFGRPLTPNTNPNITPSGGRTVPPAVEVPLSPLQGISEGKQHHRRLFVQSCLNGDKAVILDTEDGKARVRLDRGDVDCLIHLLTDRDDYRDGPPACTEGLTFPDSAVKFAEKNGLRLVRKSTIEDKGRCIPHIFKLVGYSRWHYSMDRFGGYPVIADDSDMMEIIVEEAMGEE